MKGVALLLLQVLCVSALFAELPPSAYEAQQKAATEHLKVQILRVEIGPAEDPDQQAVVLTALVEEVLQTASGLKTGDFISIQYTLTRHPKGWVGPGAVPVPAEKTESVAYLTKIKDPANYAPAAGRMSFSNF